MNEIVVWKRRGKKRYPEPVVVATEKNGKVDFKSRSKLGWKNYELAMADHDPADADLYHKAFLRFVSDTRQFRQGRANEAKRHWGQAFSHKAEWLRKNRDFDGDECLFFPSMLVGRPERLRFNFREMSAARAMLLLTQGTPPNDYKTFAIHSCGNGHLSCVNPKHLRWGTPGENSQDAIVHNAPSQFISGMEEETVEAIRNSPKLVKVLAFEHDIPAGVVSAIKLGEQFAA